MDNYKGEEIYYDKQEYFGGNYGYDASKTDYKPLFQFCQPVDEDELPLMKNAAYDRHDEEAEDLCSPAGTGKRQRSALTEWKIPGGS